MACYVGPEIVNSGILFQVDCLNVKSYKNNNLVSLITKEEINIAGVQSNGYIYNSYNSVLNYSEIPLESVDAITAYAIINNEENKSGVCFSVASNDSALFIANQFIVDTRTPATTLGNSDNYQVSYGATQFTVDTRTPATTQATETSYQVSYGATQFTVDTRTPATTQATEASYQVSYDATQFTVDTRTPATTLANVIDLQYYKPRFELTFGIKEQDAYAVNRTSDSDICVTASIGKNAPEDLYQIVFRSQSLTPTSAISLYKNNVLIVESIPTIRSSEFEPAPIQLFNIQNSGNFAQYGIRAVVIYDTETDALQTEKINNLLRR